MAIGITHLGIGKDMFLALAVDRMHFDQAITRFRTIGAGIRYKTSAISCKKVESVGFIPDG